MQMTEVMKLMTSAATCHAIVKSASGIGVTQQPAPYRTDVTVKYHLNRLILLVDDIRIAISGQSHVRCALGVEWHMKG